MRILHVLDHGLPLQSGYSFRTRAILKAQTRRGYDVAAVTGPRQGRCDASAETIDGINFHRTGAPPAPISPLREALEIIAFARSIDRVAAAWRPDLIHVHSPVLGAVAGLRVARKRRIPLLYEIRAFWEDAAVGNGSLREGSPRYRATRAVEGWAARRADAVAVICAGLRDDLIDRGIPAANILVSPNGVDLSLFGAPLAHDTALARSLGVADAEVVGFVGSFYDYEGLDDLIAAMPALVAARPLAQLVLVGGGPAGSALRAQAAASPVAAHIRFVGRVPHDEVDRYYSIIDVLSYPRKRMRLTELVTPLKPLEAMAQRRLVAASDVGGHRELIRDEITGTLFAPDDPAAIARGLAALLADRGSWAPRLERARAFVEQERDWAQNIELYAPVYQKLTSAVAPRQPWSRPSALRV